MNVPCISACVHVSTCLRMHARLKRMYMRIHPSQYIRKCSLMSMCIYTPVSLSLSLSLSRSVSLCIRIYPSRARARALSLSLSLSVSVCQCKQRCMCKYRRVWVGSCGERLHVLFGTDQNRRCLYSAPTHPPTHPPTHTYTHTHIYSAPTHTHTHTRARAHPHTPTHTTHR
jgi:hypothetical protein